MTNRLCSYLYLLIGNHVIDFLSKKVTKTPEEQRNFKKRIFIFI